MLYLIIAALVLQFLLWYTKNNFIYKSPYSLQAFGTPYKIPETI